MSWQPDYVSVAELKAWHHITDAVDDAEIALYCTGASRAVDTHTNRQFGVVAAVEERRYCAWADPEAGRWVVDVDDFQTAVGLLVKVSIAGVLTAVTLFDPLPINAAALGRPWEQLSISRDSAVQPSGIDFDVYVTALWGWTAVPTTVKLASRLQASRFAIRRESPYGIAGSPDQGSELRLLSRVDPDVGVSLNGLRRPRAVG